MRKTLDTVVAVVGVGGIGANTALQLARTGFQKLVLIDRDFIEQNNLPRQKLFDAGDVGFLKAAAAKKKLEKSGANVIASTEHLNQWNVTRLLEKTDIVLDCTDNVQTRFVLNEYCLRARKPWIFSAAIRSEVMISTIIPEKTPCFACWNPKQTLPRSCSVEGISPTATALAAKKQVEELISLLEGKPRYAGILFYADKKTGASTTINLQKNLACVACARSPKTKKNIAEKNQEIVEADDASTPAFALCGNKEYFFQNNVRGLKTKRIIELKTRPGKIVLLPNGNVITKGLNEEQAKRANARVISAIKQGARVELA